MPDCDPIGRVRTPFADTDDAPRQGLHEDADGEILLDDGYEPGLTGFEPGDDVLVVWFADQADRSVIRVRDGERGVFTTRSPERPNPICLTVCEITAVEDGRLSVRGVDMVDGSPVLDLKVPIEGRN
ncbi:tRNA (N6-threonylcarbamoyladenosine(37)-N6)-methyltransferase TrmO [Halobacteriaceae archaeon GCM10025711]